VSEKEKLTISPNASSLARSLRSIGYSFEDALCDIIDNSITALATTIKIAILWDETRPKILIRDNGKGMSRNELIEAMRPGTRSPAEKRSEGDLGRFGLGLKTASFSQSSKLSVTTWQDSLTYYRAQWDLNEVERNNEWTLTLETLTVQGDYSPSGTIVEWLEMDAFDNIEETEAVSQLAKMIVNLEARIGRTYHRFIEGATGTKISFWINNSQCPAINPLFTTKSTQRPKEIIQDRGKTYEIHSHTLPHSSKCSNDEWVQNGGPNGYLESQGFYLYRNNRLIVAGSWFGLASKKESTKLCRASIDITNDADFDWQIDIKKSSASPPPSIRTRLKSLINNFTSTSRQTQLHRSRSLSNTDILSIWKRIIKEGSIEYIIDENHPLLGDLKRGFAEEDRRKISELLAIIVNTLPTRAIYRDLSDDNTSISQPELEIKSLLSHAIDLKNYLEAKGYSEDNILNILKNAEMFRLRWGEIKDSL